MDGAERQPDGAHATLLPRQRPVERHHHAVAVVDEGVVENALEADQRQVVRPEVHVEAEPHPEPGAVGFVEVVADDERREVPGPRGLLRGDDLPVVVAHHLWHGQPPDVAHVVRAVRPERLDLGLEGREAERDQLPPPLRRGLFRLLPRRLRLGTPPAGLRVARLRLPVRPRVGSGRGLRPRPVLHASGGRARVVGGTPSLVASGGRHGRGGPALGVRPRARRRRRFIGRRHRQLLCRHEQSFHGHTPAVI
mmetsp:Transcript_35021/g.98306  ORF Transcript_35021/g.98306 Transcript_35021/m.98306 type:complete len:251 (+) Transcript_35021:1123-1875(+)